MKDEEAGVCEWERSKDHGKGKEGERYGVIETWKKNVSMIPDTNGGFNFLLCIS